MCQKRPKSTFVGDAADGGYEPNHLSNTASLGESTETRLGTMLALLQKGTCELLAIRFPSSTSARQTIPAFANVWKNRSAVCEFLYGKIERNC